MRDFARKSPTFWTRGTGKRLRGHKDAQILADYLTSSPTHNGIGLYSVGLPNICHETGLTLEEVLAALHRLEKLDFAIYDREEEVVWVKTMVLWQFGIDGGETLKPGDDAKKGDNKIKAILRELIGAPKHPFLRSFYELYESRLGLGPAPEWVRKLPTFTSYLDTPHEDYGGPLAKGASEGGLARGSETPRGISNSKSKGNSDSKSEATAEAEEPAAAPADGIPRRIEQELRKHPSLKVVATPDMAKALADRFATNEVHKNFQFAWVLDAIRECAVDSVEAGLMPEALARKLRSYCDNARKPRLDPSGPAPEDLRSERMRVAQEAERSAAARGGR